MKQIWSQRPTLFQILGFDILLLQDLRAMLLEVNANPSMRIDYEKDVSPGTPKTNLIAGPRGGL